jgi:Leucine-rich repeat (LRR) protein
MIIVTEPSRATTLPSLAGMRSLVQLTAPLSSLTGEVVLEMGPALAAVDLSSAWKMTRLTISASSSATRLASLVLGQCPAMVSLDGLCVASQSLSSLVVTGSQSLAAFDGQSVLGCVLPMLKYADFSYTPLTQFPLARGPHPALGSLRMRYLPLEKLQPYTPGALPNVLPDDLADITPNLYELDIAGSNLVALPSSLSKLKLTTLDVSQNSLLTLTPLPDPAILTTLDISGCVMLSLLNTSNLGFTSPNVVTTLRMSNLPGVLNDPTTVGPLNLTLFRHLATLDASRNPWILQSPLLAATAPLKRVDLNDCTIIGELTLPCASSLGILNFQGNMITRVQNATAVLPPSAVCWAGLTLVNAARNRLEDISFLADAVLWKRSTSATTPASASPSLPCTQTAPRPTRPCGRCGSRAPG